MLGIGCCPPPVGGCLLAAGQKATWMSCTLLTLSASKECKDCSCCQRVESIGLCKETNAVWADRVSRSLRIPLSYNSIWLCHCPAFLWVVNLLLHLCKKNHCPQLTSHARHTSNLRLPALCPWTLHFHSVNVKYQS